MKLYCIALKQNDTDQFLVEATDEQAAVAALADEIRTGGTPDRKRFAGGAMGHSVEGYRVMRVDNPLDVASWSMRTGGTVEIHGTGFNYRQSEIALLVRDGIIYACEHCSPRERPVYHTMDPRMTMDGVREILKKRSHQGIATE